MKIFKNMSVRTKLLSYILILILFIIIAGFTFDILYDITWIRKVKMDYMISTTQVVGECCLTSLISNNKEDAEKKLKKLKNIPTILNAAVFDSSGKVFTAFTNTDELDIISPAGQEPTIDYSDKSLFVSHPILQNGIYYGNISVNISAQPVTNTINSHLLFMLSLIAVSIILSIILVFRLYRYIVHPIQKLTGVVQSIAQENNYSLRVDKNGDRESNRLYDEFNNMMNHIQNLNQQKDRIQEAIEKQNKDLLEDISKRQFAEESLRESENKYKTLTTNMPGAIYRCANDPNWTMEFLTDAIEEISGYNASDFIRNNVRPYADIIHPDDRKMVTESIQESLSKKEPYIIDYRIITADGTVKWVYEKGQGVFSQNARLLWLDGIILENTYRKSKELELAKNKDNLKDQLYKRTNEINSIKKELEDEILNYNELKKVVSQQEEKYKILVSNISDVVWISDSEGKTFDISPNVENIYGYTVEEILQAGERAWFGNIHPDDVALVIKMYGLLFTKNQKFDITYRIKRKDGEYIWLHDRAITTYEKDGSLFAEGLFTDISDKVNMDIKLKEIHSQLLQSEKMASLGMLLAGVAHEINTPVGAISSMYNTLGRSFAKLKAVLTPLCASEPHEFEKIDQLFQVIDNAESVISSGTERVTKIVRHLKNFARLDENKLIENVNIHEGLEDTLTLVHHELKHKAKIKRQFGDIPVITCNPSQLNQVYLNLLINALHAIKNKGTITITTMKKNNQVHIQFKDDGVGIPATKLKKIFEPGFTTKGIGIGTGLGLAICYKIVKEHHGDILVESEMNKGSTFTVILPMTQPEKNE